MTLTAKVTIGITCFNARETVERAIASARIQEWNELEIIVVDDASTDDTAEIVARAAAEDSRMRLIKLDRNSGAAAARNVIIQEAIGDFIAFFDDDDESHSQRIEKQVQAILALENQVGAAPVACYAAGERRYKNGYVKELPAIGATEDKPHGSAVADYLLFHQKVAGWSYGSGTPTCALMARTSVLRELGGFDTKLRRVEDVDLAIRLALGGGWFTGTQEKLLIQHATESDDKSNQINCNAEVAVAEKHATYLKSINRYHYAKKWPVLRYYHFERKYARFLWHFLKIFAVNPIHSVRHILHTGPKRLLHERRMAAGQILKPD